MPLNKSSQIILNECMGLKSNESCLIITDSKLEPIGNALYKNSLKITQKSKLVFTPIPEAHGAEPPKEIANEMLKHDVILMPTTKSLSHTKAREEASKNGARIASMPGVTIDMMQRALNVDFYKIRALNKKLISSLKGRAKIMMTTKKGASAVFYTKGRKWLSDDGIYTKKGAFGNLPSGEVFIAPLEGKTSGTIIVDASVGGIGKVDKKIKIEVNNGFIESIEGGKTAAQFRKLLKSSLFKSVAELGIGTNYKARITGNVLEDEKAAGTCHIAFGNNKHFGGKVDVPFHVDVVVKKAIIMSYKVSDTYINK